MAKKAQNVVTCLCTHANKIFHIPSSATLWPEICCSAVLHHQILMVLGLGVSAAGKRLGLPSFWPLLPSSLHPPVSFQEVLLVPGPTSWFLSSHLFCPLGANIAQEHIETQVGNYKTVLSVYGFIL